MEGISGGKLLSPARRHEAVRHLVGGLGYSEVMACRIVGLSRLAYRRARSLDNQPDKYVQLRRWLHEFSLSHRRWGYRRAWISVCSAGFDVGRETVRRIWREEGLRVMPRRTRKRRKAHTHRVVPAGRCPGDVWALDFQFDSTWHGHTIKVCNILDEASREHVSFTVDTRIDSNKVVELLDVACIERGGRPQVLRMDNGPEFIAQALEKWAQEQGTILAFIPPGEPWHNGFVESFHNRMRDELFEDNCIENLDHARHLVTAWSERYNNYHPHSSLDYMSPRAWAEKWRKENTVNT